MIRTFKMISCLVYGLLLLVLHVAISTASDYENPKPIRHASGNKRSLAGGLTIGQTKLEKRGSNYGNQEINLDVNPTPTSISAETGCHYAMDLVLVLDCSHSITADGWLNIKKAAKALINDLDVSPQGTHVSVIVYSSDVENFFTFDVNQNKQALSKVIDELSFFGEWSRLDIALNAVLHHVFSPLSGARTDVPKVVAVFTDGKTDGAVDSPEEVPDWLGIIAKPLDALRAQNVTIYAVASSLTNNNYQELNLIGADRAYVINITDINKLAESLVRNSKQVCPEKPSVCASMPSSCLTSTTCIPEWSTCVPVIPPTSCTLITTTCQNTQSSIKNYDAQEFNPQFKTKTITLTKYVVVTETIGEEPAGAIVQTASSELSFSEIPVTMPASPSSIESSINATPTSVLPSISLETTELHKTTLSLSSEASYITESSSILATPSMAAEVSSMTTVTSSLLLSDAESSAAPQTSSKLIPSKSRFAAEQKKSSWFDSYLPDFVKTWMAVEP